jgi:hypothetical protein
MVYEHFSRCLILEDPSSRFLELLQVVVVIVHGDISRSVALVLRANKLLAMAKAIGGLCPITIGEVLLELINYSIILQLWGPFQEHLSPYQFGISTLGGCEAIPFNVQALFDLHLDWAVM